MVYSVLHKIGTGGFGTVHKGVNNDTGEIVAMKKLRLNKMSLREVENLKYLQKHCSPYLLCYIDMMKTRAADGKRYVWIVTEYIDWPTLEEYVKDNELSYEEKVDLMLNLAKAVKRIHDLGYVHKRSENG